MSEHDTSITALRRELELLRDAEREDAGLEFVADDTIAACTRHPARSSTARNKLLSAGCHRTRRPSATGLAALSNLPQHVGHSAIGCTRALISRRDLAQLDLMNASATGAYTGDTFESGWAADHDCLILVLESDYRYPTNRVA